MQTIHNIGLDIAKSVFQVTDLMHRAKWSSAAIEAALRPGVLSESVAMPGWQ